MRTSATILNALIAGLTLTVLTACGGGGTDPNLPEYQAYEQRHEYMHELGDALLVLNEMSTEETPVDEQVFLASARTIAKNSPQMLDHFQNQTIIPESLTKPEVFENWDDFAAKSEALTAAANALVEATESGGFAAGSARVKAVRESCSGCHRPYRAPKPD